MSAQNGTSAIDIKIYAILMPQLINDDDASRERRMERGASKQLYFVATVLRNVLLLNLQRLMQVENLPVSILITLDGMR